MQASNPARVFVARMLRSGNVADERSEDGLEEIILRLLRQRADGASICPSDAARAAKASGWRNLMDDVRAAAGRLAARGEVDVTQRGRVVDIGTARGPVRILRHRPDRDPGIAPGPVPYSYAGRTDP